MSGIKDWYACSTSLNLDALEWPLDWLWNHAGEKKTPILPLKKESNYTRDGQSYSSKLKT